MTETAWTEVEGELPQYRFSGQTLIAEEAYATDRHGGTWYLALIDDMMRRWVLSLDGRAHVWPVAAGATPLESTMKSADVVIESNQDAVKRLKKDHGAR